MTDTVSQASGEGQHSVNRVRRVVCGALLILVPVICLLAVALGAERIAVGELLPILMGQVKEGTSHTIVWKVRLPRVVAGLFVGASLAVAGAVLQGVMRNPLASPHIIGVSAGAGLAGTIVLVALPGTSLLLVPTTFVGALLTSLLIYTIAWRAGLEPTHLILSGVAVSAFMSAGTGALMALFPERIHNALMFMLGGLTMRNWGDVTTVAVCFAISAIVLIGTARRLNTLLLGDEMASSLGENVVWLRIMMLAVSSLLAAGAVSVAGLIGFVGLVVPHISRLLVGSDNRLLIPASAFFGGGLVVGCDLLARILGGSEELPVGVFLSMLGAPFFLFLLHTSLGRRNSQ